MSAKNPLNGRFPMEKATPVEDDPYHVVKEIQTRWPELTVQFLHPDALAEVDDPPFRIIERCRDGIERQVMQVWELDSRVIERLHIIDAFNGWDPQDEIDKMNAKAKADREAKFAAERQELSNIAAGALQSKNSKFTFKDPTSDSDRLITIKKDEGQRF